MRVPVSLITLSPPEEAQSSRPRSSHASTRGCLPRPPG